MDISDRNYSFGTCERELDKIHRKLKGISDTIDEKIVESEMKDIDAHKFSDKKNEKEKEENVDHHSLLTCSDKEFEETINKMTTVDLELAVIIFEQQIKMQMKVNEEKNHSSELYQLRERLTRCFLKKSVLSGSRTREPFNTDKAQKKLVSAEKRKIVDEESISSLSKEELNVLLTYNGLQVDNDNASRETLETMVRTYLVAEEEEEEEDEGEDDDWEPPMDDKINWKTPTSESKTIKQSTELDDRHKQQSDIETVFSESVAEAETQAQSSWVTFGNTEEKSKEKEQLVNDSLDSKVKQLKKVIDLSETIPVNNKDSLETTAPSDSAQMPVGLSEAEKSTEPNGSMRSEQHAVTKQSTKEELPCKVEKLTETERLGKAEQSPRIEIPVIIKQPSEANQFPEDNQSTILGQSAESKQSANTEQSLNIEQSPETEISSKLKQSTEKSNLPKTVNEVSQQSLSTSKLQDRGDKNPADLVVKSEADFVVNWNPIPLLKDLYKAIAKPEEIQFKKGDEAKQDEGKKQPKCKLDGYLEKLPVNQTKATVFKGWKKRYFKITQGKLFYFEDHLSTVPLGSILLTGSELKFPGDKTIQIKAQNNGDTISIRCLSSNECNDWYRTIKREAVISTPVTLPVPLSLQTDIPKSSTIIIDLGANTIKGGYAGENKPRVVFPAVFAVRTERKNGRKFTESGLPDPTLCKCGYEALEPETRQSSKLVFPLRPTLKIDKYAIKSRYLPGFIEKVFQELKADASESSVIISCQRNFGIKEKEILLDYLFGQLGIKAAYIQEQALFALYAYKDTTGVVVDIGDHIDVVPVLEGVIVQNGVSCLPQGGQLVTEYLSRILSEGGYRFFSEVESYIVRFIKEQSAFVSLDYEKEMTSSGNNSVVDMQKYELPGNLRSINIDDGRFRCTEGLFDPNKWGKDHEGIHILVEKAIKQTGIDHRKELCRKIYLSGGTTLIEGFAARLQKELKFLMPDTVNIQVHAIENRVNASFLGATVLSEQPSFSSLLISKDDWQKHGVNILNKSL